MKSLQNWKIAPRMAVFAMIMGLAVSLMSPLARAQNYIFDRAGFATGNEPAGVIVADFNHDRRLDLAVTNFYDNTVSVVVGTPGGAFATKVDYATGVSPAALVTADFRGDGKTDLAVVNEYDGTGQPGTVSVLLGNGDGSFQTHVDYPVGNYPVGIVAADFNGDGKIDLAVANDNDSTVSILLGNGDGTFQPQTLVSVGTEPTSLGGGDFNGDGKLDLITSNVGAGTVTVLLTKGDGTFTRMDSSTGLSSPDFSMVAVGDFNRDRKLDVVVSSQSRQLLLLVGKGDGSFQSPVAIASSTPDNIHSLLAADFNHDGNLDLVEEGVLGIIFVLLGNGDGTFRQPTFSFQGGTATATSLATADLNGDGSLDLVATDQNLNSIDILLGNGNGTFANIKNARAAQTSYGPDAAVAADFNGDGKLDLAVAETNFPHGQVSVQLGKGNATFGKPLVSLLIAQGINNQDLMRAGDFNGDGKTDLVVMDDYNAGFEVLLGNGDGTFQTPVDTPVTSNGMTFEVGDFNGDGKTDLVVTTTSGSSTSLNIYLSNGDGTFRVGAQYAVSDGGPVVADVNHDGKLDFVIAPFGSPLLVFLGNGDGTFQNPIAGPSAFYGGGTVIRDFNGDGHVDVVVGTYNGIAWLAGNGDGTFQNPVYSNSTLQFMGRMVAGNFSGDGKLGLATYPPGNSTLDGAVVMAGNGDGTFQLPIVYGQTGPWPIDLIAGDFNSDHVDDFGMPNQGVYTGETVVTLYLSVPTPNLFPTSLNLGTEGIGKTTGPKKITLTNTGNAPLKLSSITVTGDFLQTNNCGKLRPIGKGCAIEVRFKPKAKGERTGLVRIADNASASPQTVHLKGTGD
jgi:hypothetical protein